MSEEGVLFTHMLVLSCNLRLLPVDGTAGLSHKQAIAFLAHIIISLRTFHYYKVEP